LHHAPDDAGRDIRRTAIRRPGADARRLPFPSTPPRHVGTRRLLHLTIARIVIALFTTALAGGLTLTFIGGVAQRRFTPSGRDVRRRPRGTAVT